MTAIIKKKSLKTELLREFNSLKPFINLDSTEEETITSVLEQLAEKLFNFENLSNSRNNKENYANYRIKQDLRQEKDRALSNFLLHKGSFF